jgi:hypothetical protein
MNGESFDVREGCENSKDVVPVNRDEMGILVKDLKLHKTK